MMGGVCFNNYSIFPDSPSRRGNIQKRDRIMWRHIARPNCENIADRNKYTNDMKAQLLFGTVGLNADESSEFNNPLACASEETG